MFGDAFRKDYAYNSLGFTLFAIAQTDALFKQTMEKGPAGRCCSLLISLWHANYVLKGERQGIVSKQSCN